MILAETIQKIVEEAIAGSNTFIVDIKVKKDNIITVYVDEPQNITIDRCAEISRFVDEHLDREQEDFELEVSSPGLTSTFKVVPQYQKNIGKEIEVVTNDDEKIRGILNLVDLNGIEIQQQKKVRSENGKKRIVVTEKQTIEFDAIKTAKLALKI